MVPAARWSIFLLIPVSVIVIGSCAWTHEIRGVVGGTLGLVVAFGALAYRVEYETRRQYVLGYEDGRRDERNLPADGWGCRRV